MTIIYSDRLSQFMLTHGLSRNKAKKLLRARRKSETANSNIPQRGGPVKGTGKKKGATKK